MFLDSIFKRIFHGKPIPVAFGYPPRSNTWLTIYRRQRTGEWIFECDDLFADERPEDYLWNLSYMYFYSGIDDETKKQTIERLGARIW